MRRTQSVLDKWMKDCREQRGQKRTHIAVLRAEILDRERAIEKLKEEVNRLEGLEGNLEAVFDDIEKEVVNLLDTRYPPPQLNVELLNRLEAVNGDPGSDGD